LSLPIIGIHDREASIPLQSFSTDLEPEKKLKHKKELWTNSSKQYGPIDFCRTKKRLRKERARPYFWRAFLVTPCIF